MHEDINTVQEWKDNLGWSKGPKHHSQVGLRSLLSSLRCSDITALSSVRALWFSCICHQAQQYYKVCILFSNLKFYVSLKRCISDNNVTCISEKKKTYKPENYYLLQVNMEIQGSKLYKKGGRNKLFHKFLSGKPHLCKQRHKKVHNSLRHVEIYCHITVRTLENPTHCMLLHLEHCHLQPILKIVMLQ